MRRAKKIKIYHRMKVIKSPEEISRILSVSKKKGKKIGLVPTMGYLHEGHFSLIRKAGKENDITVVSIFVNPTQFAPGEDYKRYPRDLKRDRRLAAAEGADIIFYPDAEKIYPAGYATSVFVEGLSSLMCGRSRPAHFKGVTTICAKLFNIIKPDIAYFGQKDYQQAVIIMKMVKDLNMPLRVKILPIIREREGLAMSSRNKYLNSAQRQDATVLYRSLKEAKRLIDTGEKQAKRLKSVMQRMISEKKNIQIDYIAVVDSETLAEKKRIDTRVLIALAARAGKTRLIDNILVNPKS